MAFNKLFSGDNANTESVSYVDKAPAVTTSVSPVPKAVPVKTGGAGRGARGGPTAAELDVFAHQPNNIVSTDEYKLNFIPNILDNYDVYTYHWKLFITSIEDASAGNVMNIANQVIIVESGVSDLRIDKVELHGIPCPSIEAGTGTQTRMKFELIEPSGAGLFDKMYYQATALGIGNWAVMPCYLQLEFRGRDPVTSETAEAGGSSLLAGQKWVWPISLTKSKAHVSHIGTRYEFDAMLYDEIGQTNAYFAIQQSVTLTGLDKFGDAMRDLEDKINADQYAKLIENYSIPDTYRIVVDPLLENIGISKPNDHKSTSFGADYIDFKKKTASFLAGTGVDKIVDAILSNTDDFQMLMQGSTTPTSEPKTAAELSTQMKSLWRVITETKPIAYDSLRQTNAVAITVYIVKYDIGLVDVTASQTGQTPDDLAAAKKRMIEYVKRKILSKKYNYIFTGLNDQIINFDLNMNFSFATIVSRFGGIYYDSAIKMPGVAVQKKNEEVEKKAKESIRKILQFINDAKPGKDTDAKIKDARDSIQCSTLDPILRDRYISLLDNAKKVDRQTYIAKITKAGGISASGSTTGEPGKSRTADDNLSSTADHAKYLSNPVNGLRFVSDVNIKSPESVAAANIAISTRKGKMRPMAFREGQNENTVSVGIDPTSDSGRARSANIFATALYAPSTDNSLASVKLTIKGDPFWLYPAPVGPTVDKLPYKSNMPDNVAIQLIKDKGNRTTVNTDSSDTFIVVRFRTPRIYDETTDDPYTEVEMFSGVYKVTRILSKFEGGKFTQELSCILDPMINLTDFLKDMEADARQLDAVIVPPQTTLPVTAIKTQKLAGDVDALKGQALTARSTITGTVVDTQTKIYGRASDVAQSNIPYIRK